MSETPSQPTTTPARRRQGRGNARAGAHKAYASENDVSNFDPTRYDRLPRTPQKAAAVDSATHANVNSKQRSRNKPRTKNASHSPESARPGRHTPPHQSSSIKTANMPAFAGATFHASPAPSALPLPSFLSRPNTESPSAAGPTHEVLHEHSPLSENEAPTPSYPAPPPASESPLDFMFRAHREEKERHRSGSFASYRPSGLAFESPSSQSPYESGSFPKPATLPQAARSQPRLSHGGIDGAELDGTPGRPMGPAFSTPYQERIKAARTHPVRSPDAQTPQLHRSTSAQEDPTEALKKYLFGGPGASATNPMTNGFSSPRPAPPHTPAYSQAASEPSVSNEGRGNDIQAMEDNLRRILKLDLGTSSPNTERRLFS